MIYCSLDTEAFPGPNLRFPDLDVMMCACDLMNGNNVNAGMMNNN